MFILFILCDDTSWEGGHIERIVRTCEFRFSRWLVLDVSLEEPACMEELSGNDDLGRRQLQETRDLLRVWLRLQYPRLCSEMRSLYPREYSRLKGGLVAGFEYYGFTHALAHVLLRVLGRKSLRQLLECGTFVRFVSFLTSFLVYFASFRMHICPLYLYLGSWISPLMSQFVHYFDLRLLLLVLSYLSVPSGLFLTSPIIVDGAKRF